MLKTYPTIPEDIKDVYATGMVKEFICTGSSIICNPPVLDTDRDYVLLMSEEDYLQSFYHLENLDYNPPEKLNDKEGYELEIAEIQKYKTPSDPLYLQFFTMRKGKCNIIVTCCETLFKRWWNATVWATTLNLKCKEDRRNFFMLVKYGPESAKGGGGVL